MTSHVKNQMSAALIQKIESLHLSQFDNQQAFATRPHGQITIQKLNKSRLSPFEQQPLLRAATNRIATAPTGKIHSSRFSLFQQAKDVTIVSEEKGMPQSVDQSQHVTIPLPITFDAGNNIDTKVDDATISNINDNVIISENKFLTVTLPNHKDTKLNEKDTKKDVINDEIGTENKSWSFQNLKQWFSIILYVLSLQKKKPVAGKVEKKKREDLEENVRREAIQKKERKELIVQENMKDAIIDGNGTEKKISFVQELKKRVSSSFSVPVHSKRTWKQMKLKKKFKKQEKDRLEQTGLDDSKVEQKTKYKMQKKMDKLVAEDKKKIEKAAAKEKMKMDKLAANEKKKMDKLVAKDKKKIEKAVAKEKMKMDKLAAKEKKKMDKLAANEKKKIEKLAVNEKKKIEKTAAKEKKKIEKAAAKEKMKMDKLAANEKMKMDKLAANEKNKIEKAAAKEKMRKGKLAADEKIKNFEEKGVEQSKLLSIQKKIEDEYLKKMKKLRLRQLENEGSRPRRTLNFNIARTTSDIVKIKTNWTISNFSLLTPNCLTKSPVFTSSQALLRLKFCLDPYSTQNPDHSECFLEILILKSQLKHLRFKIIALNANGVELGIKRGFMTCGINELSYSPVLYLHRQSIVEENLIPNDEVHIKVHIKYIKNSRTFGSTYPDISIDCSMKDNMTTRFKSLFEKHMPNMPFSDYEIHVDGNKFKVNKCILAARSLYFNTLFESESFVENNLNKHEIQDFKAPVVYEMLRFLYTDEVNNLYQFAKELLHASDMYMIPLLKSKCQVALAQTLNIVNCTDILVWADLYSAPELKRAIIDFLIFKVNGFKYTLGWQMLEKSHPNLFEEINLRLASVDSSMTKMMF